MTTTFPTDTRGILNECDATTGWTGTSTVSAQNAPLAAESTNQLGMGVSTSTDDAYVSITSDDYSQGGSLFVWVQANGDMDTLVNGGIMVQVADGTNFAGYHVGGSDQSAFRHDAGPVKWECYILDLGNKPANSTDLTGGGTEANLDETAITEVGVAFKTLSKALGGGTNCYWDILRFADPGEGVTMQGGTTAPAAGNGEEAAVVDRAGGNQQAFGVFRELGSGVYGIQGNAIIGNSASATDQFWEESNVTYSWEDRLLFDRNYYRFSFIGASGQTSSIIFNTSTLSVPSTQNARLDANGADLDVVTLNACTLLGWNVGIIGSDDTGDDWTSCTYIGCAALEVQGCDHTDSTFSEGLECALIEAQDETSYDDTATEGSFSAGASYAATDTIVMSNGQTVTVDTVSTGAVTEFTVTTSEGFPAYPGHTLTQASTSGSGTGFELWPRSANLAEGGSIFYDLAVDPDGELDGISFTKGTDATHAIVFGPNIPSSIALRGQTYSGYNASDAQTDSVLHFLDTTGTITVNIVGNGDTPSVKTEGATINVVASVTVESNGMTEGVAVKAVARETVGTITLGDVLDERLTNSSGVATFTISYEAAFNPSGLDVYIRAAQNGLPNAAIIEDPQSTFVDNTTAANSTTGDDMLLTADTTQAVNDAYYLGHSEQFVAGPNGTIRFKLEITQAHGANEPTITWEFWDGLAWSALTFTDADPNADFLSTGEFIYEFDAEAGWATTTVNSQGPFYYVRARVSGAGTSTTGAEGRFSTLDVTKYFRQDLSRVISSTGLTTTVPWNINTLAKFDPLND